MNDYLKTPLIQGIFSPQLRTVCIVKKLAENRGMVTLAGIVAFSYFKKDGRVQMQTMI